MGTRTEPNTVTASQEASTRTLLVSLSTRPLLSILAAAYVLVLLYLPRYLLSLLLSPVAVSALLLLAAGLLHFGCSARLVPQTPPSESRHHVHSEKEEQQQQHVEKRQQHWPTPPCGPVPSFPHKPVLWWSDQPHTADLISRGPLEVIYEEYEGEEDDDGVDSPPGSCQSPGRSRRRAWEGLELRFGADDDSGDDSPSECNGGDTSSPGWESPEKLCFLWEVEEDGMIEISLEEDNLIEIDLSACR